VPKNITLRKIEVWHNRWIFKNEFFNNFPTNQQPAQIINHCDISFISQL